MTRNVDLCLMILHFSVWHWKPSLHLNRNWGIFWRWHLEWQFPWACSSLPPDSFHLLSDVFCLPEPQGYWEFSHCFSPYFLQMRIYKRKFVTRLGLMHMIATNLCVWLKVRALSPFLINRVQIITRRNTFRWSLWRLSMTSLKSDTCKLIQRWN